MKKENFFSLSKENEKLNLWLEKSKEIDVQDVEKNLVNISDPEFGMQLKTMSEENIDVPQIRKIIEVLSLQ